jgi:endo-1,4-beta-xylanase
MKKNLLTRRSALYLSLATLTGITAIYENTKFPNQKSQLQAANNDSKSFDVVGENTLKQRAKAKNIIYGAFHSVEPKNFSNDLPLQRTFVEECDLLVGGFYSGNITPQEGVFDFSTTDYLATYALQHQILFRGHPLVWYIYNSEWLINKFKNPNTSAQEIANILTKHVSTIVRRYAGKVHSWDVVNEAINIQDGRPDGFRDSTISGIEGEKYPTWFNFLGSEYIELAFHSAARADSKALLVYNDNAMEYDTPEDDAKRNALLNLLKRLKSNRTPIHALGIQAHLDASKHHLFNPTKLRKFLGEVASLGLQIMITELDVSDSHLPSDINLRDRLVAAVYEDFLSTVLQEPAVTTVVTWGLSDRDTWLSWFSPRQDSLPVRPLPFDDKFNRKLAWNAMARAFDNAPKRDNPIQLN